MTPRILLWGTTLVRSVVEDVSAPLGQSGAQDARHISVRPDACEHLSVVVYDPVPLFAQAVSLFLAAQPGFDASGVSDLGEFMASLAGTALVVLSCRVLGPRVWAVLRRVRDRSAVRVVVLGPDDSARSHDLSVGKGADAYVCERMRPLVLVEALWSVADGTARPCGNGYGDVPVSDLPRARLTPREEEVISLVAEDLTSHQIASVLGVSERTVHSHLRHAYKKLGVHGRLGAVLAARSDGLLLSRPSLPENAP
jgi:two-component system nitrate/nitrite response regulator NarL